MRWISRPAGCRACRLLGDLRSGTITYRNVIRQHMLSETLEEKLANEKTLETVVTSNNGIRAKYEKLITSPEERALYEEWSKLWDSYKKGTLDVMDLSRKSAGKMSSGSQCVEHEDCESDRPES